MNHLAHALLAGADEGWRLGGVLGDFVRGAPDPALPASVRQGIALHRAIDGYTDRHPEVLAARALFEPPYRRYAGIALDMWFDHCLARDFGRWSPLPLAAFSTGLRELLHQQDALLPDTARRFARYMQANDLPAAYADPAVLERALAGIGQRLKRDNPLGGMLPALQALDEPLQQRFEAFFPQLQRFASTWRP
ncbi:ACP phosphodiesterase [Frateuria hangzhouensis]|uniref:acyl carrier protein phosphodiesterase n=1 Tax=Frateuria hangzhouensis TaxID=2995589 RepID=UPI002260B8A5|nr:ACP phosphodiesterase [Frateuria sp. STR12]MCX7513181.1 ACP phosphodiesterase [Frateuria sp. STR12]